MAERMWQQAQFDEVAIIAMLDGGHWEANVEGFDVVLLSL